MLHQFQNVVGNVKIIKQLMVLNGVIKKIMKLYNIISTIIFALIPEIIYFTLFLIFTKQYNKNKLLLFLMLLIGYISFKIIFPINIYFQLCFTLYVPLVLKFLYKEKFHISDIFVFSYSSIILIAISCFSLPIYFCFNNYILAFVLNRFFMFIFLFLFKNKLHKIYLFFIKQWNRNYMKPNKIKAITIRQICVVSLNVMIYILNIWISYINN